ncbi:MAG: phage Gp37/Gp68 family protein [Planctomycetota bacterium]|nr:phage Gp37/Gp68 family protein [Planctomycetota bacterium]
MSEHSSIEWTDATWNPVTGCTKISPGCKHCYAETFAERFRGVPGHPYEQGFDLRLWSDRLELPLRWRKPRRIFVNSMSDLFHDEVPDAFVDAVFATMRRATWHTFQVLTKRSDRLAAYIRRRGREGLVPARDMPNVWLGVSVETQRYVTRAHDLVDVPAAVRFLSCEPLLGPLDLSGVLAQQRVNWVIVGGESGRRARPVTADWVRAIREQCAGAGVPFFFKQWGGTNKARTGRLLDGRTWDELPDTSQPRTKDLTTHAPA